VVQWSCRRSGIHRARHAKGPAVIPRRSRWIGEHPLVAYFVFAFSITWIMILPLALSAHGLFPFVVSEQWHFLGASGPIGAAFIVTGVADGKAGVIDSVHRLTRRRVAASWLLVSGLSPFAMFAVSVLAVGLFGGTWPAFGELRSGEYATWAWVGGSLLSAIAYGVGEEAGWRGFALPRLQYGRSALRATFTLSILWGLWHVPMFFYRFEFGVGQVVGFFVGLFAGAIWLTFLYNSTAGATSMVALWHTGWNIVNIVGLAVSVEVVSLMSAMVIVLAVIIVIAAGPARLSRRPKHTIASTARPTEPDGRRSRR